MISKKKLIAGLVGVITCLTLGMSVLAAPSPTSTGLVRTGSGVDKNGNSVEIVVSAATQSVATADLPSLLGSGYVNGMTVVDVKDVSVVGDASLIQWPVTITFNVAGVTSSSKIAVLHYVDGAWKSVSCSAGEGTITATFDSLSPVAFIVDTATSSVSATSGSSTTSPKTGDFSWVIGFIGAAAIGCAALTFSRKRA